MQARKCRFITDLQDLPIYLRKQCLMGGQLDVDTCKRSDVYRAARSNDFSTNKRGIIGNSDSKGLGMSTGRGILRNMCDGSWTLCDLTSQSEHCSVNGKDR